MKSLFAIALLLGLVAAAPASAQDMSFAYGGTTIKFQMPDDWFSDPNPDSTIVLKSPDHSGAVTISIVMLGSSPDELADVLMSGTHASPPQKQSPATISGHEGFLYLSSIVNSQGVHTNIRLTIVRLNEHESIVCMAAFRDNIAADQQAAIDSTIASIVIGPPV